jgi:hypothetical protein
MFERYYVVVTSYVVTCELGTGWLLLTPACPVISLFLSLLQSNPERQEDKQTSRDEVSQVSSRGAVSHKCPGGLRNETGVKWLV